MPHPLGILWASLELARVAISRTLTALWGPLAAEQLGPCVRALKINKRGQLLFCWYRFRIVRPRWVLETPPPPQTPRSRIPSLLKSRMTLAIGGAPAASDSPLVPLPTNEEAAEEADADMGL